MSIEIREVTSTEMKKNIKTVKNMTNGMCFDEKMAKVNWGLVRTFSNLGYMLMPKEKGVKIKKTEFGGVEAEISTPKNLSSDDIIIYIHGGGFVSGSASSSRAYCSMLAVKAGVRVFAINYSLAPEHPFPEGFNDCYNAYSEIAKISPDSRIAVIGESAGANLALGITHKAIEKRIRKPSCVIVHSPFVDFSGSLDRTEHEIDDFTVKEGCLTALNEIYVKDKNPKNPLISPIFGDFGKFPPVFITCDYNETLFADSMALYNKCKEAGCKVKMIQMKGAFHAFAAIGTGSPETRKILEESIEFFKFA